MTLRERAPEVHKAIPLHLHTRSGGIIRRASPRLLLQTLNGGALQNHRRFEREFSRRRELIPLGSIVSAALWHLVITDAYSARSGWSEPRSDSQLFGLFKRGVLPEPTRTVTTLNEAIHRARENGYAPPARLEDVTMMQSLSAAGAAAEYHLRKRLLPSVLSMIPAFTVSDLVEPELTYFVDQLWIVDADGDGQAVRLIALDLISDLEKFADAGERRDGMLQAMGYEVLHGEEAWLRVDPQRFMHEFFRVAAIPHEPVRELSTPGPTISDYRCHWCRAAMIRDTDGYGIVEARGLYFHEECFNAAVDGGGCEDGVFEDDFAPTVLNFR
ncbi:MAG TPA: hypothetical protein VGF28_19725 [Thermoanaerobaculia bacterium]|jgi:hypothetical protein